MPNVKNKIKSNKTKIPLNLSREYMEVSCIFTYFATILYVGKTITR